MIKIFSRNSNSHISQLNDIIEKNKERKSRSTSSTRFAGSRLEVSNRWTIDTPPWRIYGIFAAARTWLFVIDEWFSDRRQRGPECSKELVLHCTSLAGVIVSDCTLISTLHSALPLLVHLSSISDLRKWDIHVLVGVKLLTYPVCEEAFQSSRGDK